MAKYRAIYYEQDTIVLNIIKYSYKDLLCIESSYIHIRNNPVNMNIFNLGLTMNIRYHSVLEYKDSIGVIPIVKVDLKYKSMLKYISSFNVLSSKDSSSLIIKNGSIV